MSHDAQLILAVAALLAAGVAGGALVAFAARHAHRLPNGLALVGSLPVRRTLVWHRRDPQRLRVPGRQRLVAKRVVENAPCDPLVVA